MTDYISRALKAAGYDSEPTEANLIECFKDFVDSRAWIDIEPEDVYDLTVKEMCYGLMNLGGSE